MYEDGMKSILFWVSPLNFRFGLLGKFHSTVTISDSRRLLRLLDFLTCSENIWSFLCFLFPILCRSLTISHPHNSPPSLLPDSEQHSRRRRTSLRERRRRKNSSTSYFPTPMYQASQVFNSSHYCLFGHSTFNKGLWTIHTLYMSISPLSTLPTKLF